MTASDDAVAGIRERLEEYSRPNRLSEYREHEVYLSDSDLKFAEHAAADIHFLLACVAGIETRLAAVDGELASARAADNDVVSIARRMIVAVIRQEQGWLEQSDFTYLLRDAIETALKQLVEEGVLIQPIREHYTLPEFDVKYNEPPAHAEPTLPADGADAEGEA